jgi:GT2 family glycosyltransferase
MTLVATNPAVSIVVPTRNRPALLERALASFAAQTFRDLEVIVVDDGSTDECQSEYPRIWRSLDHRFTLVHATPAGRPGLGASAARNLGVQHSSGEFLGFLDDDDHVRLSDHLAVAIPAMRQTGADIYLCNMRGENGDVVTIPDWFPDSPTLTAGQRIQDHPVVHELALHDLLPVLHHHVPNPNCWLTRRPLFDATGGFWERLNFGEDFELFLRAIDRADRLLYRPDAAIGFNVTPRDSAFGRGVAMMSGPPQMVAAMLRVAAVANRPGVRRCARAVGAWYLRRMAHDLVGQGRARAALALNWQALSSYPTVGACIDLLRAVPPAASEWRLPPQRGGSPLDPVAIHPQRPPRELPRHDVPPPPR